MSEGFNEDRLRATPGAIRSWQYRHGYTPNGKRWTLPDSAASGLNESDAAYYLRHTPQTLSTWRLMGIGPRYQQVPDGGVVYSIEDLDAWIMSGENNSRPRGAD